MSSVKLSILNFSRDFHEEFGSLHSRLYPWCILLPFWLFQCVTILSAYWPYKVVSRFFAIWFSELHLTYSNLAPYAVRFSLASIDWRITPVLHWSKVYTYKSWWSDWHHTIFPCPRITSKLCAKARIGQTSQNWTTSGSIEWCLHIHQVRFLYGCFRRYSLLSIGRTH